MSALTQYQHHHTACFQSSSTTSLSSISKAVHQLAAVLLDSPCHHPDGSGHRCFADYPFSRRCRGPRVGHLSPRSIERGSPDEGNLQLVTSSPKRPGCDTKIGTSCCSQAALESQYKSSRQDAMCCKTQVRPARCPLTQVPQADPDHLQSQPNCRRLCTPRRFPSRL